MDDALPAGLRMKHPCTDDQGRVLALLDEWWAGFQGADGARQRVLLLPRLFFQHFNGTSYLVERTDGRLMAFLIGFVSQSQPQVGYIHCVGVDPELRRTGVASVLYERFFADVAARGARRVECITSPGNTASVAFHTRLGFEIRPGQTSLGGVAVQRDYDGPGLDRVAFMRPLAGDAPP